ncbi:MAG: NAD-dependent epimerase/dehydratase family protein [Halodesulfurarchaeum sp.]
MPRALVIGGTRFIGRSTVRELLAHDYDVTIFTRGNRADPFVDEPAVSHVEGDRTNDSAVGAVAESVEPDVVVDCIAYKPREVEAATRIFEDVHAYVYVSSGDAYGVEHLPKREDYTPLEPCTREQATDDSEDSYGARKAEGDRAAFRAAERGVNAMVLRPPIVYGPHDYTDRLRYWIQRIDSFDRVLVPGDGTNVWHRTFVDDVASALRVVAERGDPGEAYNVGDRDIPTMARMIGLIAGGLDTTVERVHASERELSVADLALEDLPLYRSSPHVLSTGKLSDLGWEATPLEESMSTTVEAYLHSPPDSLDAGPNREAEERVLRVLDTL